MFLKYNPKEGLVMIQKRMFSKLFSLLKYKLEESQILFIYRYLSLLITSVFYVFGDFQHSIIKKLFIIGCLTASSIILSHLYLKNEKSEKNIKVLLFIETVGNSILLIPSGGINSPFIWYTLNTILISSIFLKRIYCYTNLLLYILTSSIIIYFGLDGNMYGLGLTSEHSNLILSLIMIVAVVQLWSIYVKKIKEKNAILQELNNQLELANKANMEYIELIESLYKSVNILTNQGNKEGLIKILYEYTEEITNSNMVFYYDISEDKHRMITDGEDEYLTDLVEKRLAEDLNHILESKTLMEMSVETRNFAIIPIRTTHKNYGILGCEVNDGRESIIYRNNIYQLQFLSELISTAFERLYLEEINERLLLTQEQNRIANEIHDSVLQRLFSLSCGIFALMRNLDKLTTDNVKEELDFMRKAIDTVLKELRNKIYGLSWRKSGSNSFVTDIKKYIDETKKLNNVIIPFSIVGNDELLSCEQKKVLYRMICEGISNAVRHGKAENIEVTLKIDTENSTLNIIDDGVGFDLDKVLNHKMGGLGIQNLYQLSESLGGNTKITSIPGEGTKLEIMIPNRVSEEGEKVFYESTSC